MGLISSSFALETVVQADGSRWCTETHLFTGGIAINCAYLSAPGTDNAALAAARGPIIAEKSRGQEAIGTALLDAPVVLIQQTISEFLIDLRSRFKVETKADACRICWWLLRRIADGSITDAQCQTAFALSAAAWTNAKANTLTPRSNAWAAILAAVGV